MAKEDQELNVMRGQSSSWFFIEELSIGMLSVNVTLSLTSSLDLSGQVRVKWVKCCRYCFFIEELSISLLCVKVTLSLTSSLGPEQTSACENE